MTEVFKIVHNYY